MYEKEVIMNSNLHREDKSSALFDLDEKYGKLKSVKSDPQKNLGLLDSIRARTDDKYTLNWIDRVEKNGADEPYVGTDFHNVAALKGPYKGAPVQPIPVPVEKIGDLKGVLGKGVLKGESDPFAWLDNKYGVSRDLLAREKDNTLKIFTRSDLIAHDDYIANLNPQKHEVNIVISTPNDRINRMMEPGAPSIKRRITAANKLAEQGYKVKLVYQNYTNSGLGDDFYNLVQPDGFTTLKELRAMGLSKDVGMDTVASSISDDGVARLKKILGVE